MTGEREPLYLECPCCGDVAASGEMFTDGQPLECACRGHVSVTADEEPHVFIDDCECEVSR